MDPGILCFHHCEHKVFCTIIPEQCPVCKQTLDRYDYNLLPFRYVLICVDNIIFDGYYRLLLSASISASGCRILLWRRLSTHGPSSWSLLTAIFSSKSANQLYINFVYNVTESHFFITSAAWVLHINISLSIFFNVDKYTSIKKAACF